MEDNIDIFKNLKKLPKDELELIFPTKEHKKQVEEYLQEFLDNGENEIAGDGGLDRIKDFDKLISNYRVNALETIATDGIATNMAEYINALTDEEFEIFVDYHLKNCNRKDLIGYSSHVLKIIEKL